MKMDQKIYLSLDEARKVKGLLFSREWPLQLVNELAPIMGVLEKGIKVAEAQGETKDGES